MISAISRQRSFIAVLFCFTCSGMSALIYEVAWIRSLELIFGATTFAIATVLASFMGGLALGSYFMGRQAARFARFGPLVVYGVIECLIGGFALCIPLIFRAMLPIYQWSWGLFEGSFFWFSLVRFLLSVVILLVPTFLMGATLPLMSIYVGGGARAENQRKIGLLYAFNTGGAVLGCALAGLWLFPAVGLAATQWVAVLLNGVAAAAAFLLARRGPAAVAPDDLSTEPEAAAATSVAPGADSGRAQAAPLLDPAQLRLLVGMYAVSGLTAMLYEVAWSRVLVLVLGSSTYAYTVMLTTFLFGLALGAYLGTRVVRQAVNPLIPAAFCQLFIAATTFAGLFCVEELPFWYLKAYQVLHPSERGLLLIQFGLAATLMVLPTLGLGAMFPLTIRGLNPDRSRIAREVGWAYALNTFGAILGSVLAGFWLVPVFGSQKTMMGGMSLNAALALAGLLAIGRNRWGRSQAVWAAFILLFIAHLWFRIAPWDPHLLSSGVFRYVKNYGNLDRDSFRAKVREVRGQILMFEEGLTCTVTVGRTPGAVTLLVNGKPDASSPSGLVNPFAGPAPKRHGDLPTQILSGEIPLLVAPRAERVLVIGLGSGVTLGSVLRHPVREVECIELEQAVVSGSRFFNPYSGAPLDDPRVRMVVNDGRNHLLLTDQTYDVIISEPSNPWIAGAASLFTREFFEIARARLRQDGVFCQWLQLYELHDVDFNTLLRSFQSVFPHVHLFRVANDAVLIATLDPRPIALRQLEERWRPEVAADLERIDVRAPEDFLAYYWIGGEDLKRNLPAGPLNTDDNMRIEFTAPLRILTAEESGPDRLPLHALSLGLGERSSGLLPHLDVSHLGRTNQSEFWTRLGEVSLRRHWITNAQIYLKQAIRLALNPEADKLFAETLLHQGKRQDALSWMYEAERDSPGHPSVLRFTAELYYQEENWERARQYAERLLARAPRDAEGQFLLGKILYQQKDWNGSLSALEPLERAGLTQTNFQELPLLLGSLNWLSQNYTGAVQQFERYLREHPGDLEARRSLADSLYRLGRREEATIHWQRAGQLRSEKAVELLAQGMRAWDRQQFDQALARFEEAWPWDPWNEELNFYLARARRQQKRIPEAIQGLGQFLTANPQRFWAMGFLSQLLAEQGDAQRAQQLADYYHAATGQAWIFLAP